MRSPSSPAAAGTTASAHRSAIDLRRFEGHERLPLLEMSLAALDPGETLQVTFPAWPEALLPWLEHHYGTAFTWQAGGEGEEWSCLLITREAIQRDE